MHARDTDAIPLAPRPSLEQYRKLAKDLVKALRANDRAAVGTWAAAWIQRLTRSPRMTTTPLAEGTRALSSPDRIHDVIDGIVVGVERAGLLHEGSPPSGVSLSAAQLFIARLHGFTSWRQFSTHVAARQHTTSPISQFEAAADAVASGNGKLLTALLGKNPDLVQARSTRQHGATLLHYVAANGHEGFRQHTPPNAVAVATVILENGADPDARATMYNHQCTTLQMLVSNDHPDPAGVKVALVHTLVDYGAAVDGVERNGSPLMTALRFHNASAADALVARGARVDNVLAAAALGRTDLIEQFVTDDGSLRPVVQLAFGPWPGLPPDPQVHLGYALTWAARFGHREIVEVLLRKRVDPNGHDDDATALHFAAAYGRLDIVRLLLHHGASLEALNSYDGTVLDGTVWYALNAPVESVDYAAVVRTLLDAGARVDGYPELKGYVDAVLAGRRGDGYPDGGERKDSARE